MLLFLPQGIFPTQGLNTDLLHCRKSLYCLSYQGSPIWSKNVKEMVVYNRFLFSMNTVLNTWVLLVCFCLFLIYTLNKNALSCWYIANIFNSKTYFSIVIMLSPDKQNYFFNVVVLSLSHVQLFVTPWTAAHQASLSFIIPCALLKFMSIEAVMPSNHLIFCCPLLLLPEIFPSIRVFSNELAVHIRWPKYWSFSFVSELLQSFRPSLG